MIVPARLAKQLADEYDWEKHTLDQAVRDIMNTAKIGFYAYHLYPSKEAPIKSVENVINILKKEGYDISVDTSYGSSYKISWK